MNKAILNIVTLSSSVALWLPAAASAETLPRSTLPLTVTLAMIQEASKVAQLPPSSNASAVLRVENHGDDLAYVPPRKSEQIPNGCARNPGALCYDYQTGSAVYKPMRSLLPDLPGMTPHNLSLRRNKIVAQYTFK